MPDAHGNFKGMLVPAAAWERVFGPKPTHPCTICGGQTYPPHTFSRARICRPCDAIQPVHLNRDKKSTNK